MLAKAYLMWCTGKVWELSWTSWNEFIFAYCTSMLFSNMQPGRSREEAAAALPYWSPKIWRTKWAGFITVYSVNNGKNPRYPLEKLFGCAPACSLRGHARLVLNSYCTNCFKTVAKTIGIMTLSWNIFVINCIFSCYRWVLWSSLTAINYYSHGNIIKGKWCKWVWYYLELWLDRCVVVVVQHHSRYM